MNPSVGKTKGDNNDILAYAKELENEVFIPAFHYHNNSDYILQNITDYAIEHCMLICSNDIGVDDKQFKELIQSDRVSAINIEDPGRNRTLTRFLKGLDKSVIRFDDLFEKQVRNSAFLDIDEHLFSEEHLYYQTEGGFNGFSDYTVLPSEYSDSGSTPRAVVIHLTYLNEQDQVLIRHFTSENNDSIANIQGKFAEAAEKAVGFCRAKDLTNSAIQELEDYYDREHYPGLGIIKKISIKNHLLLISHYLKNR